TAWNSREPRRVKPLSVKVVVAAPATPPPSLRFLNERPLSVEICHWYDKGALPPRAATVRDTEAVWPTVAVASAGSVVIASSPVSSSIALLNESAMYTVPTPSMATLVGTLSPEETRVMTVLEDLTHSLSVLFNVSAMYTLPLASTATPSGPLSPEETRVVR